jgi:WD40 repeat protein
MPSPNANGASVGRDLGLSNAEDTDERLAAADLRRYRRMLQLRDARRRGVPAPPADKSARDAESDTDGAAQAQEVYEEGTEYNGEDILVSKSDLHEIWELFQEYEEDGGMEVDDFVERFGPIVRRRNAGITDTDLVLLFMRVDANANHSVDWGEISTYLLMSTEKEAIRQSAEDNSRMYADQPSEQDAVEVPEVKLLYHEHPVRRTLVPNRRNLPYVTADDYTVKFWQPGTLRHIRTPHLSRAAITDVVLTPQWADTVGVACMDNTLTFYDASSGDLHHAFIGQRKSVFGDLLHTSGARDASSTVPASSVAGSPARRKRKGNPVSAAFYRTITRPVYSVGLNHRDEKRLHFSDKHSIAGYVETSVPLLRHFVKDTDILATVLFDLGYDTRHQTTNGGGVPVWGGFPTSFDVVQRSSFGAKPVLFCGLRGGAIQTYGLGRLAPEDRALPPMGLLCDGYYDAHSDWVSRLRYISALESIVTCSWDGTLQVRPADRLDDAPTVLGPRLPGQVAANSATWNSLANGHARRVLTFDYHESLKMIASCAPERDALVWSPYISRPLAKLESPKGRLVDVHFCQSETHLVTLSDDHMVRLWDLRTYRCVTTLNLKKHATQRAFTNDEGLPFQSISYDEGLEAIVSTAKQPLVWNVESNEDLDRQYTGHRRPVLALTYASQFGQLISVDGNTVIVWDVVKGATVMRWDVPVAEGAAIVDATVDRKERRLLVALNTGEVHVYNYINAFALKTCMPAGRVDPADNLDEILRQLDAKNDAMKHELYKQTLLTRRAVGKSSSATSASGSSAAGAAGQHKVVTTNAVCFGQQVRPRKVHAIVSTTEDGKASIHIDDEGGEKKPQRVVNVGDQCFCCAALPRSVIVFGIRGCVSSYSLEEVGTRAQRFDCLPAMTGLTPEDPLMVALFPGELQADPRLVRDTNELDREESFGATMNPADLQQPAGSVTFASAARRRNSARRVSVHALAAGFSPDAMQGGLATMAQTLQRTPSFASNGETPLTPTQRGALAADAAASRLGNDSTQAQMQGAQSAVRGITECIQAITHRRRYPYVATGHGDGLIRFWHVKLQRETHRFRAATVADEGVYGLTANKAHTILVAGDRQGYVSVFDVSRIGTRRYTPGEDGIDAASVPVESLVFMLYRFRAHPSTIASLTFIEVRRVEDDDDESGQPLSDMELSRCQWQTDTGLPFAASSPGSPPGDDAGSIPTATASPMASPSSPSLIPLSGREEQPLTAEERESQAAASMVDFDRLQRMSGGKDIVVTSSSDCLVKMWTIDGKWLRVFGDQSDEIESPVTARSPVASGNPDNRGQVEHSTEALAAMDIARVNEIYSFIECCEGCSLEDIFDEFLGSGHPFTVDVPARKRGETPSSLPDGGGRFLRGPLGKSRHADSDGSAVWLSSDNDGESDSVLSSNRHARSPGSTLATPPGPTGHTSPRPAAAAAAAGVTPPLVSASSSASPQTKKSARMEALDAEARRAEHLRKLAAWSTATRRCFEKGTYNEKNVGRVIRKLLQAMIEGRSTVPACIVHHDHGFFVRTRAFDHLAPSAAKPAVAGAMTTTATTSAAASPHSSAQASPRIAASSSNFDHTGAASSGAPSPKTQQWRAPLAATKGFEDTHDATVRFSRTSIAQHIADLGSGAGGDLSATAAEAVGNFPGDRRESIAVLGTTTSFGTSMHHAAPSASPGSTGIHHRRGFGGSHFREEHRSAKHTVAGKSSTPRVGRRSNVALMADAAAAGSKRPAPTIRLVGESSAFAAPTPHTAGIIRDMVDSFALGPVRQCHEVDTPLLDLDTKPVEDSAAREHVETLAARKATWHFIDELIATQKQAARNAPTRVLRGSASQTSALQNVGSQPSTVPNSPGSVGFGVSSPAASFRKARAAVAPASLGFETAFTAGTIPVSTVASPALTHLSSAAPSAAQKSLVPVVSAATPEFRLPAPPSRTPRPRPTDEIAGLETTPKKNIDAAKQSSLDLPPLPRIRRIPSSNMTSAVQDADTVPAPHPPSTAPMTVNRRSDQSVFGGGNVTVSVAAEPNNPTHSNQQSGSPRPLDVSALQREVSTVSSDPGSRNLLSSTSISFRGVSRQRRAEGKVRRQLEQEATKDDVVSRALRQALNDRDEALAGLRESARRAVAQRIEDCDPATLAFILTGGGGGQQRRTTLGGSVAAMSSTVADVPEALSFSTEQPDAAGDDAVRSGTRVEPTFGSKREDTIDLDSELVASSTMVIASGGRHMLAELLNELKAHGGDLNALLGGGGGDVEGNASPAMPARSAYTVNVARNDPNGSGQSVLLSRIGEGFDATSPRRQSALDGGLGASAAIRGSVNVVKSTVRMGRRDRDAVRFTAGRDTPPVAKHVDRDDDDDDDGDDEGDDDVYADDGTTPAQSTPRNREFFDDTHDEPQSVTGPFATHHNHNRHASRDGTARSLNVRPPLLRALAVSVSPHAPTDGLSLAGRRQMVARAHRQASGPRTLTVVRPRFTGDTSTAEVKASTSLKKCINDGSFTSENTPALHQPDSARSLADVVVDRLVKSVGIVAGTVTSAQSTVNSTQGMNDSQLNSSVPPAMRRALQNAETLRLELSANLAALAGGPQKDNDDDDADSLCSDEERDRVALLEQLEIQAAAAAREKRDGGVTSTHDAVWVAQTHSRLALKPLDDMSVLTGESSGHKWLKSRRNIVTDETLLQAHGRDVGVSSNQTVGPPRTARNVLGIGRQVREARQNAFARSAATARGARLGSQLL